MSPVRSKDEMIQRQTSKQVKDATPSLEHFVLKALLYIEGNIVTLYVVYGPVNRRLNIYI